MGNAASADLASAVTTLTTQPVPEGDEEAAFWLRLLPKTAISTAEFFSAIQPETVRQLLKKHPRNLALLLLKCIEVLHDAVPGDGSGTLSNAVRLLTRLVPVVFEAGEDSEFIQRFFWENQLPTVFAGSSNREAQQQPLWEPLQTGDNKPIGAALVHAVMTALFLADYSVSQDAAYIFANKLSVSRAKAEARAARHAAVEAGEAVPDATEDDEVIPDEANAVWPMLLWRGGVGFPKLIPASPSTSQIHNRIDLLRLLIALCSQTLFATPVPQSPPRSPFLDVATQANCPYSPTLFYCLLNTVLGYDPVGLGVPYATAIVGDKEQPLASAALQTLLVLLDYAPLVPAAGAPATGAAADGDGGAAAGAESGDAAGAVAQQPQQQQQQGEEVFAQFNIYRSLLSGLSEELDLDILYQGLTRLLKSYPAAEQSVLPGAYHPISFHQELLVLLWKLLDENQTFLSHVLSSCDITAIAEPLLYLMWSGRSNVTKVGLIHLCTFLLLLLSGERSFGVGLNAAFTSKLPAEMPLFEGSHADLLLIVLHKLIVDGSPKLSTLYSCFLTIICNVTPYSKNLSLVSSVKLVNLFELFSSPRFLFARPHNYAFVAQLVESFNNLIQYQYESNAVLIYSIIRRRDVFEHLATVSVSSWKADNAARLAKRAAEKATKSGLSKAQKQAAALAASGYNASTALTDGAPGSPSKQGQPLSPAGTGLVPAAAADAHAGGTVASSSSSSSSPARERGGSSASVATVGPGGSGTNEEWASKRNEQLESSASAPAPVVAAAAPAAAASSASTSAAAGGHGGGWAATDEWFDSVRSTLPLAAIQRLCGYLSPLVEEFIRKSDGIVDDEAVVNFLRATTVVGVLPVPHPILMRKYQPNQYTSLWFTTFMWSTIFLHLCKEVPLFDAEAIKLFSITVV